MPNPEITENMLTYTQMIDILTEIYDCRLQSLIGYTKTECTREIASFMLYHFDTLATYTKSNVGYRNTPEQVISSVLSFLPSSESTLGKDAETNSNKLIRELETFIKANLEVLYLRTKDPASENIWRAEFNRMKADESRVKIGSLFSEELKKNKHKYPEKLRHNSFFSQLNYTTQYRNKISHPVVGYSGFYNRHIILQSYDILLTYLLYTFYFMAISPDVEFKHLI